MNRAWHVVMGSRWRAAASRGVAVGLCLLLTTGIALAQTSYQLQPVARLLDITDPIAFDGWFRVGSLDDQGRVLFTTMGLSDAGGHHLMLYGDGAFRPLVLPDVPAEGTGAALGGRTWPKELRVLAPVSMNQRGQVVFAATPGTTGEYGVFLWDAETHQLTDVALPGALLAPGFTLVGARFAPAVNNRGEIALTVAARNAVGALGDALLIHGPDGARSAILLPGQALPGGGRLARLGGAPTLSDGGAIALVAVREGDAGAGAYLWDRGTLTPLLLPGALLPVGRVETVVGAWVNNKNRNLLVAARIEGQGSGIAALCRFAAGALAPVVVAGQEMPGGGRLLSIDSVSFASEAGAHVFVATLSSGSAAYLLDAEGQVSLILKSGAVTDLGRIAVVGSASTALPSSGIGVNSRGQVALPALLDDHPPMLLLVTPRSGE